MTKLCSEPAKTQLWLKYERALICCEGAPAPSLRNGWKFPIKTHKDNPLQPYFGKMRLSCFRGCFLAFVWQLLVPPEHSCQSERWCLWVRSGAQESPALVKPTRFTSFDHPHLDVWPSIGMDRQQVALPGSNLSTSHNKNHSLCILHHQHWTLTSIKTFESLKGPISLEN